MIPFINRSVDFMLSDQIEARDVNVREVIDEIRGQFQDYTSIFEAVVLISPGRYRVTCKSSRKLAILEEASFTVRGLPISFKSISSLTWVNVSRLSFGVPEEAVRLAFEPYGSIKLIKSEQYAQLYTGVRHLLMDICADIPARLRIAGHYCVVHYKGQKKLCFSCGKEGHTSAVCPSKLATSASSSNTVTSLPVNAGASTATADLRVVEAHAFVAEVSAQLARQNDRTDLPVAISVPTESGISSSAVTVLASSSSLAVGTGSSLMAGAGVAHTCTVNSRAGPISSVLEESISPDDSSATNSSLSIVADVTEVVNSLVFNIENVESSPPLEARSDGSSSSSDESIFSPPPTKLPKPSSRLSRGTGGRGKAKLKSRSPRRKDPRLCSRPSSESEPGVVSEDFSFESDVVSGGSPPGPFPNSEPTLGDFFANLTADDLVDTPLTQFTPNLPCPTQDRITFLSGPEHVSDEFSLIVDRQSGDNNVSSAEDS